MVSYKNKYMFLHIPKTGGTSIVQCLMNTHGVENVTFLREDWLGVDDIGSGDCGVIGHNIRNPNYRHLKDSNYKDTFIFTFVRNPWERLVSAFFYLLEGGIWSVDADDYEKHLNKYNKDFRSFVRESLTDDSIFNQLPLFFKSQHYWMSNDDGEILVDYIGKLEDVQKDFNVICDKIGIPHQEVSRKRTSTHKHYTKYYDEETREIVAKRYRDDIKYFGYKFESSTKCCKILTTYFGPRHRRIMDIGWPFHGQDLPDAESCLTNLKFLVDIEKNLDAGILYDTIIINNDVGYEEGNSWLDSIHGTETKCGKVYCFHRENKGKNFAGYRHGYEKFKDKYDYFMFIPDDHVILAKNYYSESLLRYIEKMEKENCAVLALIGTGTAMYDREDLLETTHAHDGISLIHKKYIEEHYEKFGSLAAADDADNILLDDNGEVITTTSDIVWNHVFDGEIPFTANFIKLGYKVLSYDGIHDCVKYDSLSLTSIEKYKTWRYNKGMSCRGGGWPIELNGEIFCSPIYNLFHNHPGGVYMSDFKIDESILRTVLDWKIYISEKELLNGN